MRQKYLHYEIDWEREPEAAQVIDEAWSNAGEKTNLGDINKALGKVMSAFKSWSNTKVKNVCRELEKARKKLVELMQSNADRIQIRQATDHMNEMLYREEMLWLQRSRVNWLKEGDRNTRFFHSRAVWRAKKNKITKLRDAEGTVQKSTTVLEDMATEYFEKVYTADPNLDPECVTRLIQEKVTEEMNAKLCADFNDEEIAQALFQIGPLKSPDPDGFPARFYQRNWGTLKADIVGAVRDFFQTGLMPEGVNNTAIVLIPKIEQPLELKDYRPISLCNVVYKVVSKCLVNRLRPVLDEVVSEEQSAFIQGRMITDNALLAFECFHAIQKNKVANKAACVYKLDLSKAYDRVDWRFLEMAMKRLGFAHRWVRWIISCVTSVRYSIKFNGTLLHSFAPSRGLRQGDPLSLFLFLFVADGLSLLLKGKVEQNILTPIKFCRNAPSISHLMFADDTLLFFKAEVRQAEVVNEVLLCYARGTGQLVNQVKSSIMFGAASPSWQNLAIRNTLRIEKDKFEDKYLGFPTPEGRMHKGRFQTLQAKICKRVIQWGENYLSSGGKEILIKAVIQAIPVYVMGIFKLPDSICEDLTRLTRNFWWGADNGQRKTHWRAWESLTKPKRNCGLGFKDIRLFNQALLARQAWRLIEFSDSLCAKVLKAKYFPHGSLIDTTFGPNASPAWQGMEHGIDILKKGIIWRIGNGNAVRIWRDPWLPRDHSRWPIILKRNCRLKWFSDLLDQDGSWNAEKINRYFLKVDADVIYKICTSPRVECDFLAWHPDKTGQFSVRSAYALAANLANMEVPSSYATATVNKAWDVIWK